MNDSTDNIILDTATRIFLDLCEPATVNDAENRRGYSHDVRLLFRPHSLQQK